MTLGVERVARMNADGTTRFSELISGLYELSQFSLASKFYVASAKQGERDALEEGVIVTSDSPALEVRLKAASATVNGVVVDSQGRPDPLVRVLLIPDVSSGTRYRVGMLRTDTIDQNGHFELDGLVPGRYLAFAATDMNVEYADFHDVTWIDPEFLSRFRNRGVSVTVEDNKSVHLDLELLK